MWRKASSSSTIGQWCIKHKGNCFSYFYLMAAYIYVYHIAVGVESTHKYNWLFTGYICKNSARQLALTIQIITAGSTMGCKCNSHLNISIFFLTILTYPYCTASVRIIILLAYNTKPSKRVLNARNKCAHCTANARLLYYYSESALKYLSLTLLWCACASLFPLSYP